MSLTVVHSYVSQIPDSGDTTLVEPSDWNANHVLTGVLPSSQTANPALTVAVSTRASLIVVASGTDVLVLTSTAANIGVALGAVSARDGIPLQCYVWSISSGTTTFTPDGSDTIMGLTTWSIVSQGATGGGGSLYLIPMSTMAGWTAR
jgi:hypothetical protein